MNNYLSGTFSSPSRCRVNPGRRWPLASLAIFACLIVGPSASAALVHQWTFNGDAADQVGTAHGGVVNGATISGGVLSLDGINDLLTTVPIDNTLTNKTLVTWVRLDTLAQAAGSALTLQAAGGGTFDGVVYGERTANQWMNGSNGFSRSNGVNNGGAAETVTNPGEVMMAISYGPGGAIDIYRNGAPYASYTTGGPVAYNAGNAHALIGLRHSGAGGDPFLEADINEARIYDTALTAGEVAAVYAAGPSTTTNPLAMPLHRWSFNDGTADDSIGTAHGTLINGASVSGGRLALDGVNDYVRTDTIDATIDAKTLVAWVSLDNTAQRSGGVITLENPTGADVFDAIVYGERTAGQWMNGSTGFSRSGPANNGGPSETITEPGEVMMAISYRPGGEIDIYRDGTLYASYTTGGPISYDGGVADVLFGLRHLDIAGGSGSAAGNDQWLAGFINEARIYGVDLTDDQVALLFQLGPDALALSSVPEPSSLVLLATGLLIWAGRRKR